MMKAVVSTWKRRTLPAFTLIELLVAIAVIALLVGILLPALAASRNTAQAATCLSTTRQMAIACHTYAQDDRNGYFPTAAMGGSIGWIDLLRAHLDPDQVRRCPSDHSAMWNDPATPRVSSYGLNGYFTPNHPPYWGLNLAQIRSPSRAILAVELADWRTADHFMPMFWGDPVVVTPTGMFMMARTNEWDSTTHLPRTLAFSRHTNAANYVFADAHAAAHRFTDTWQQTGGGEPEINWYDPR